MRLAAATRLHPGSGRLALGQGQRQDRLDSVLGHALGPRPLCEGFAGRLEQGGRHARLHELRTCSLAISWPICARARTFEPITRVLEGLRNFYGFPLPAAHILEEDRKALGVDRADYLHHLLYGRSIAVREKGSGFDAPRKRR
jgi:hypothetical protein